MKTPTMSRENMTNNRKTNQMTNISELASLVGQSGLLEVERTPLRVRVKVLDAKRAFDRLDVRVTPEAGEGEAWVSLERVTLDGEVKP
jgi:hypothetical protein